MSDDTLDRAAADAAIEAEDGGVAPLKADLDRAATAGREGGTRSTSD